MNKEVAPPGKEDVVKALKNKKNGVDNPWAVAWAQHNKEQGKKKRVSELGGLGGPLGVQAKDGPNRGQRDRDLDKLRDLLTYSTGV